MPDFDGIFILFLNQLARASWSFDHLINFVSQSNLMKGGVIMALLWWVWFRCDSDRGVVRGHVIATLVGAIVAIGVGRALALNLPFRARPMHDPALGFVLPYGASSGMLESWSSLPSDHAVLFFAIAAGIWFASRTMGLLAMLYVAIMIALPRLYLGLHYPTDIVVGAFIGIAIAAVANWHLIRTLLTQPALRWHRTAPGSFYAFFFLLSFQVAVLFEDGRDLAQLLYRLITARL